MFNPEAKIKKKKKMERLASSLPQKNPAEPWLNKVSLNRNEPKHLICFSLGTEVFMKCHDEQALLSPLNTTGEMRGISHSEQPEKLPVPSIIQTGCFLYVFQCEHKEDIDGSTQSKKKSVLYV